jgi:hypothetical protein
VSHRRVFHFDKKRSVLLITDTLNGTGQHTADWYFHFDYQVEVECLGSNTFRASADGKELLLHVYTAQPLKAEIQDGWVSPSYGIKLPAKIVKFAVTFADFLILYSKICARDCTSR